MTASKHVVSHCSGDLVIVRLLRRSVCRHFTSKNLAKSPQFLSHWLFFSHIFVFLVAHQCNTTDHMVQKFWIHFCAPQGPWKLTSANYQSLVSSLSDKNDVWRVLIGAENTDFVTFKPAWYFDPGTLD